MSATGDRLKGKAKTVEGKLAGEQAHEDHGKLEEMKGEAEPGIDRATKRAKAGVERARARVSRARARGRNRTRTSDV